MPNEEQFLPGFAPQAEKPEKKDLKPNEPKITEKIDVVFDDEKIQCQYCEDVGPCQYCDRGKEEIRKLRKK